MDMITRTTLRRTLIEMALRHQRAGSGSSKAFLTKRTARMNWPDLTLLTLPVCWGRRAREILLLSARCSLNPRQRIWMTWRA